MEKKGLRFGIICDNIAVEGWQANSIKKMLELENVEAGLLILLEHKHSKQHTVKVLLKSLMTKKSASLPTMMNGIPILECEVSKTETGEYQFSKNNMEKIAGFKLDFLFNISSSHIGGGMAHLSRYGLWAFQHSSELNRYFWEIYNEEPVTFAGLVQLTGVNKPILLKEGYFSTIKDSYKKNREHITSTISSWPALVCRDILNNNAEYLNHAAIASAYPIPEKPTMKQMGKFIVQLSKNKYKKLAAKLFSYEYWNIGIVPKPIHEFLTDSDTNIQWLVQEKDLYYADPFAYRDEGGLQILMEELDHRVVKGYISAASVRDDTITFDQALMKFPCHMSYPFIIEHNNQVYCLPETSEAKEATIYRLNKASKEWEKVKTLIEDFHAVDSTIIKYGDYWWLFCTKSFSTIQSHNNELHIYYAADLLGDWQPHVLNPVKMDIRSSRPAGTPFIQEGVLYRPAQDCSKTYGGRIVLNKIKTLSTSQFEEEPVSFIEPKNDSLYPDGVHTISNAGGITILDGKRFDYSLLHFFRKLYKFRPVQYEQVKLGKMGKNKSKKRVQQDFF
ncbi:MULTISPECIES: glucosamine inositolphosphorylceramide transferase family protein [Bacillaceae]|uniref:glucosamine inositolphosphorylceramide transferase family protein n=1 Tax=Bacillaceae TaxID=186817 RepID=UPI00118B7749|nr:hypothetical protein [Bacillus sp. S3]QCJ43899.1 hypothetical protein FAY30_19440 [Bacillus sp. S3]